MTVETSGQASEATGMTEAQAAETILAMLTDEGQSEDQEPLEGETPQAEAEDDAEEADPDAEEQSDADDDEGEQDQQQEAYTVKVDGEELKVTLEELTAGYQREADYRRKTMAVAEERKALEPERQALAGERAQLADRLKAVEASLSQNTLSPEELDYLRSSDPQQYAVLVADQLRQREQVESVKAERQRLEAQNAEEDKKAHLQTVQKEAAKLLEARPEWSDPAKGKEVDQTIRGYAKDLGVTPEEFEAIADHRIVIALHEAALWRQLQAKTPQVRQKVEQVKAARPGTAAQQPSKVTEVTRAKQRLAKTGRVQDAADVFLKRLG